jgi:hypothetical protein
MNEDLEKNIQDIKYTLDTVIGLVVSMMLMQIIIVFGLFLYITW